ncbi:hypothetical protein A2W24_05000 [Microgenomates group bacterium RBG_16_45_19]|nr:MAG: hypothetical protein A2W24_05000 [Microgenomates group bacterium RBG_16_45_19]
MAERLSVVDEPLEVFIARHEHMTDWQHWLRRIRYYDAYRQLHPGFETGESLFHIGLSDLVVYLAMNTLSKGLDEFRVGEKNAFHVWEESDWAYFYQKLGFELKEKRIDPEEQKSLVRSVFSMYYLVFSTIAGEMNEAGMDWRYNQFFHERSLTSPQSFSGLGIEWLIKDHYQTLRIIADYLNPAHWWPCPEEPYYVWVTRRRGFPSNFPKILSRSDEESPFTWATGFGGRLVVSFHESLSQRQLSWMWSDLLVRKSLYESPEYSDNEFRQMTLEVMGKMLPGEGILLDLGGGKGDFVEKVGWWGERKQAIIMDSAEEAIRIAKEKGIDARVVDLRQGIPLEKESVDVAGMVFTIQWLPDSVLKDAHRVLRRRGKLLVNVYPNDESTMDLLRRKMSQFGFEVESYEERRPRVSSSEHGVAGEEMVVRVIEAIKP